MVRMNSIFLLLFAILMVMCTKHVVNSNPDSETSETNKMPAKPPNQHSHTPPNNLEDVEFAWTTGQPIIVTDSFGESEWIAIKDPSIVHYEGRWHLYCTLRGHERTHAMVYTSFDDFSNAGATKPVVLPNHDGYFCAPQVFYYSPQEKWYMICQAKNESWDPVYQAAFATTTDISDPNSWSELTPMQIPRPSDSGYLDFWVIGDEEKVHLFFTCDNGKMWRAETTYDEFPFGWGRLYLSYKGDIFEASHIYRLKEYDVYINIIEAQAAEDRRYHKAFIADSLDGEWRPIAADLSKPYAAYTNIQMTEGVWANSISHGELIRAGYDEKMLADLHAPFIFQAVMLKDRKGKPYGKIPWKLGLLRPVMTSSVP